MKRKKVLKYFELTFPAGKEWQWQDYVMFVISSLYQTIFPFIGGMLLVQRQELVWIFMLIMPIYFRFRLEKKEKPRKRRIYMRD